MKTTIYEAIFRHQKENQCQSFSLFLTTKRNNDNKRQIDCNQKEKAKESEF